MRKYFSDLDLSEDLDTFLFCVFLPFPGTIPHNIIFTKLLKPIQISENDRHWREKFSNHHKLLTLTSVCPSTSTRSDCGTMKQLQKGTG